MSTKDRNVFLLIVALFLPIVGYILYFMYRSSDRDKANELLACAIGGSVVGLIIMYS